MKYTNRLTLGFAHSYRCARSRHLFQIAFAFIVLLASDCTLPTELCSPVEGRIGFFSQGDCIYTRSSFFQGHEWLTYFGNESLPDNEQFASAEVQRIANGNRRVDWPSELLVHLDNGILAYRNAMALHTDLEENQPVHFLLGERNSEEEAIAASIASLFQSSHAALVAWVENRNRALALLGRANHTLQDSFSNAHSVRREEHASYGTESCRGTCGCIIRIKAYRPRSTDKRAGILFHGGRNDLEGDEEASENIGHMTPDDSIYQADRSCREPVGKDAVWACLTRSAHAAAVATGDYFAFIREQVRLGNTGETLNEQLLQDAFQQLVADHFSMCASAPE